ncbi:MAG: hypothetical protein CFH42_01847 [Alphaproteobacteria bacterium MarineAlpha12_Bin1]|nr:MAG: hypothetical protein CFH42_01847 [Alphaproteobacteria bacterium MarineAlpha12_Bin1]
MVDYIVSLIIVRHTTGITIPIPESPTSLYKVNLNKNLS